MIWCTSYYLHVKCVYLNDIIHFVLRVKHTNIHIAILKQNKMLIKFVNFYIYTTTMLK